MTNDDSAGDLSDDTTAFGIPDTGGSGCDVSSARAEVLHGMTEGRSLPSTGGLSQQALTVHEQSIRLDETLSILSNGITRSISGSNRNHSDHEILASHTSCTPCHNTSCTLCHNTSCTPCHNTPERDYVSCYRSQLCSVRRGFFMDGRPVSRHPLNACTRAVKVRVALCSVVCFNSFIAAMVLFMIDASEGDIQLAGAVLLIFALVLLSLTLYDAVRHQSEFHPYQTNNSHTDSRIPEYFPQWFYQMQYNSTADTLAATSNYRIVSNTDQDLVPIILPPTEIDSPPSYEVVVRQPSLYPLTTTDVSPAQRTRRDGRISRVRTARTMQLLTTIPEDETLDFSITRTAVTELDHEDPPPPYTSP